MQGRDTLTFSQNLLALADHKFEKGGLVLQAYAPTIEKNFLKLLELNFYLRSYSIFYSVWKRDGRADKDKLDPVRVMNTLVYDKRLDVEQKIWEVSDKYIEYRVFLLMGYFELTSKGTAIRTNPYRKAFDFIQTTYDGMLKDRMGSYLLIKSIQRDPGILPILPIAAETMTDSLAKQTLMSAYHAVRPGKKALNFDLEDENGKTHRLDDYKGKNLVIKFWFTGCTGCAQIKNSMSVIQQKFKDDKSIVFLNVNMSTQKTHWIEGLKSGKYTSSGEVNLYTGGLGIRHPLVKYYQFASAPQLLLINRRGIVYSANPPIPFTEQKTVELINMIKEMR
ncbi:hypothetical protein CCY01nite_38650 [Chitinophaga cymbidii]|uniref:Thioredoxin domain-containing protein n=2 Tax=Chitinophaga cymbidii TaxID=1096750 RepID=A0A512RPI1_9BACT|nr:hypothetical protein CCY01nite_38650 [Chitinophaga cymbidii]